jgi:hypothetical protein
MTMSNLMDIARAAAQRPTYKELKAENERLRSVPERMISAVRNYSGLSDDEKRIVVAVLAHVGDWDELK